MKVICELVLPEPAFRTRSRIIENDGGTFAMQYQHDGEPGRWIDEEAFPWSVQNQAAAIKAAADALALNAISIEREINFLREGAGDTLNIGCDHEEERLCTIICNANFTGWQDRNFSGETLLDALKNAASEKEKIEPRPLNKV